MSTTESTDKSLRSKKVFTTLANLLGLQTEVKDKTHNNKIILNVSTDEPGRLIGRKGSSLDSMRLIMDRILQREEKGFPNIIIDVEGYEKKPREKRAPRKNDRRDNRQDRSERNEAPAKAKEEAPKAENVKVDAPKTEAKTQAPKQEAKKNDAPKTEAKTQAPKQEAKKNDAPKADAKPQAPKQEAKKNDAPKADKPQPTKQEAKKDDAPKTDKPQPTKQEAKKDDAPKTEAKTQAPKNDAPKKKKPTSRIEQQCRNAAKELKRWGESQHLPPMPEAECFKALDYFKADDEIIALIDEEKSFGAKKRVKLSLKNEA